SKNRGHADGSRVRGQPPERTGSTSAVAAIVERDGLLLAENHCRNRGQVESLIVRVPSRTTVAGPWPICIRAMARDANDQIWLLADLHPHYEVETYNVLFRLDASGSVLHHEYTLDREPELEGTGGLTHMEVVDGMIWLSGVETPVIRLRRDGDRWIEERIVPGGFLAARGAIRHVASLGLFAQGFVAETCSTSSTAAFRLRALDENPGARRRVGLHHGLLAAEFRPAPLVPPLDPLADPDLPLLLVAGREKVDPLPGDAAQLVGGPAADREILVS